MLSLSKVFPNQSCAGKCLDPDLQDCQFHDTVPPWLIQATYVDGTGCIVWVEQ